MAQGHKCTPGTWGPLHKGGGSSSRARGAGEAPTPPAECEGLNLSITAWARHHTQRERALSHSTREGGGK